MSLKEVQEAVKLAGMTSNPGAMLKLYAPLLEEFSKHEYKCEIIRDKRYGSKDRNLLDIYVPLEGKTGAVVIWMHGGGFITGSKQWITGVYENVGTFFASNGFICVIPSFSLVPDAKYPTGGNEFGSIVKWTKANVGIHGGDPERIIGIAHTTGATFLAEWLYGVGAGMAGDRPQIAAVAFLSGLFTPIASPPMRLITIEQYYGTEMAGQTCPLSLMEALPATHPHLTMPTALLLPEFEKLEFVRANTEFLDVRSKLNLPLPVIYSLKGHNHISNILAIGLGDQEAETCLLDFVRSL